MVYDYDAGEACPWCNSKFTNDGARENHYCCGSYDHRKGYEYEEYKRRESMSEELKITKGRVLEAADSCGTAKEVLKKLFPEVFEVKEEWEDVSDKCRIKFGYADVVIAGDGWNLFAIRGGALKTCDGLPFDVKIEGGRIWRKKS